MIEISGNFPCFAYLSSKFSECYKINTRTIQKNIKRYTTMTGELIEDQTSQTTHIPDLIQKRYISWKKNSKLLYDYLNTNLAKWPSLTCQLMPDLNTINDKHRVLLSSFTSSQLPADEAIYISEISTMKHLEWSSLNNFDMDEMEFKADNRLNMPSKNLQEEIKILFPSGECNRARYMSQNPDIIGAAASSGSIYIYDKTKHGSNISAILSNVPKFQIECKKVDDPENIEEVLSLAWNWQREGLLAACYSGGSLKVWDITKYQKSSPTLKNPQVDFQLNNKSCNDVSWMINHQSILSSCNEIGVVAIYDIRMNKLAQENATHHQVGVNSVKFNYHHDMLICSGDSEGTLHLWDIRNMNNSIKTWSHGDSISTLEWNYQFPTVISTADQGEGLVKIWDVSQSNPLLFIHGGHTSGVNDISWDHHDPWLMCSVANDNSIHLWKPANNLV